MEAVRVVGWNLRRLRVAAGISQDDLALSAELDRAYVGRVERASVNPTVGTLEKLANALSVPIIEFFREPVGADPEVLKGGRPHLKKGR